MATSTSTLLDVVNSVLLDVGERQVTSLSSPVARKAVKYVKDGVREIQRYHAWDWLYTTVTPTNWLGDTAKIPGLSRVFHVSWAPLTEDLGTWVRLHYLDPESFEATTYTQLFDSVATPATRPVYYTLTGHKTLRVNPYPSDVSGQTRVKVYGLLDMEPPTTPTGVFPMPEEYISMLNKYATAMMYMHHLDDPGGANAVSSSFREQLLFIRNNNAKSSGLDANMYRRNRRYTR